MFEGVAEFGAQVYESLHADHFAVFGDDHLLGGLSLASPVDVVKTTPGAKTPNELAGLRDFLELERLSFAFSVFIQVTIFRAGINGALGFALGFDRTQKVRRVSFLQAEERKKDCNSDPQ